VGIGTSSPIATLTVQGTSTYPTINSFVVASSSGDRLLEVTPSGNVGIGTSTPANDLYVAGTASFAGNQIVNINGTLFTITGTSGYSFRSSLATSAGTDFSLASFVQRSATSGTLRNTQITTTFAPTSGSATYTALEVAPTINQGQAASGISRGLYITPTVTTSRDFRAIDVEAYTATTVQTTLYYGSLFNAPTIASSSSHTLTNARHISISGATIAGNNMTISSSTALYITGGAVNGGGTVTNAYGLFVQAPSGATNNSAGVFMGNVGIGTTTPTQGLHIGSNALGNNVQIANGWLCVDNNDSCTGASTAGTVYAVNAYTTGADVAENYPTNETLEPGDVVMADGTSPVFVKKASMTNMTYRSNAVLGVVSTQPGILLNGYKAGDFGQASTVPVALSGRVPIKITNENGNIKIGDYLTTSKAFPGFAMKATYSGEVIGQALENFDPSTGSGSTAGKILVFMSLGFRNINNTFVLGEDDGQLASATSTLATSHIQQAFLINQKGSGKILQLQQNGVDRLLVANDGSLALLAQTASTTQEILEVKNASSTLFTINAQGDAQFTGNIIVSKNTAGTAVVKEGDNLVKVTFENPYPSVPKVIVSVNGVPNFFYGVVDKSETGFTIQLSEQTQKEFSFDWVAVVQPEDTESQSGISFIVSANPQPTNPPAETPPPASETPPAETNPPAEQTPPAETNPPAETSNPDNLTNPPAETPLPASETPPAETNPPAETGGEVAGTQTGQ
jgi:hypothetical protein